MVSVNPYLNFNGNAEEAFTFYKSVFGGEFGTIMKFIDVPTEFKFPDSEANKIMHVALPLKNGSMLMGCDIPEVYGKATVGNNFTISINAESKEEADKVFGKLSAGGKITMPMNETFWGSYFGMLTDKFEIHWMVSFDLKKS